MDVPHRRPLGDKPAKATTDFTLLPRFTPINAKYLMEYFLREPPSDVPVDEE
jgi:hypothetical protein